MNHPIMFFSSDLLCLYQSLEYLELQNAEINVQCFFTFHWQSFVSLVLVQHVSLLVFGLVVGPSFPMGRVFNKNILNTVALL